MISIDLEAIFKELTIVIELNRIDLMKLNDTSI